MRDLNRATLILVATALMLAGCAGGPPPSAGTSAPAPEPSQEPAPTVDSIDCAEVEAVVAPYIEGLVPREDNGSDEFGTLCGWEVPADARDLSDIRSVEVSISAEPGDVLTAEELGSVGLTALPDSAIESAGGVAYTSTIDVAVASVIVTTVALPTVEVTVTGGQWDGHPSLDGPAAVAVVKTLLGL